MLQPFVICCSLQNSSGNVDYSIRVFITGVRLLITAEKNEKSSYRLTFADTNPDWHCNYVEYFEASKRYVYRAITPCNNYILNIIYIYIYIYYILY